MRQAGELVASHAAMFDHLAEGRFILGISPGALASDAEVLGILGEDRNKMFAEAIDVILRIWERDPPYDIDLPGNRYKVTTKTTFDTLTPTGMLYKPYQSPRPEIVGTVVAPHSKGVIAMGERDFHPLSANFLYDVWLTSHWDNYALGKANAGKTADRADWRVARTIMVADDDKVAKRYGISDENTPTASTTATCIPSCAAASVTACSPTAACAPNRKCRWTRFSGGW